MRWIYAKSRNKLGKHLPSKFKPEPKRLDLIAFLTLNLMLNIALKACIEVGRVAGFKGRHAALEKFMSHRSAVITGSEVFYLP
jgi:hypothetical protein